MYLEAIYIQLDHASIVGGRTELSLTILVLIRFAEVVGLTYNWYWRTGTASSPTRHGSGRKPLAGMPRLSAAAVFCCSPVICSLIPYLTFEMRKTLIIVFISSLHFMLTVVVFFISFGISWTPRYGDSPSNLERIVNLATAILHFPLVPLIAPLFLNWASSPLQFLQFIPNSILWGIGLYFSIAFVKKRSRNH